MTPSKAADIIGITVAQVRHACRKGTLRARKKRIRSSPDAYYYDIKERDVLYYKHHRPRTGPKPKRSMV